MAAEDAQDPPAADSGARHGRLPARILAEVRAGAQQAGAAGAQAAEKLDQAAEPLRLEVLETRLPGPRALVGHILGLRLLLPAEGLHGPREAAALLYLFRDAIAIRPTDDAPLSAIPLVGLHVVLPQVAVAHWLYKAGRIAHANVDLEHADQAVEADLTAWTVDDFRAADDKLQVFMVNALAGPVHVYQRLGFVRLAFGVHPGAPVRLKSALPEPSGGYRRVWDLVAKVIGPGGLTMDPPGDQTPPGSAET